MTTRRSLKRARLAAGALVTLSASGALAQSESSDGLRLVWSRGPEASSCSDESEVQADVVRRLGWSPFSPSARHSIEGHVTRENGTWTAVIEERDAQGAVAGSRVVTSAAESCASLGAAAGLAIALIVRSGAVSPPSPPPPPPPPPCPPVNPAPPEDESRRAAWFAAAVVGFGVLPRAAVGASLLGDVPVSRSLSVTAALSFLPEVRESKPVGDFGFSASYGALGACYNADLGADVGMSGCVSAALGAIHVAVYDPLPVEPGSHLLAALTAGPRLRVRIAPPVELVLGADVLLPLKRDSFVVETAGTEQLVFETPPVGALVTLGLGFAP